MTLLFYHCAFAQDAAPQLAPTQQENPAHTTNDRNTSEVLAATERMANQTRQLLAALKAPPHPVWITSADEEVLGFWQEDMSGAPKGAVLMLHAAGQTPRWPDTLLNLHRNLPQFGWATLSVELPAPASQAVPPRQLGTAAPSQSSADAEGSTETIAETAADDTQDGTQDTPATAGADAAPPSPTLEQVEQEVEDIILAALGFINQRNIHNIVLYGEGLGAARALVYAGSAAGSMDDSPVRALVLLDVEVAAPVADTFAAALNNFKRPVLDLTTSVDFAARAKATHRRQLSLKVQHPAYFARNVPAPETAPADRKETQLSKAVRGFISRRADGREL